MRLTIRLIIYQYIDNYVIFLYTGVVMTSTSSVVGIETKDIGRTTIQPLEDAAVPTGPASAHRAFWPGLEWLSWPAHRRDDTTRDEAWVRLGAGWCYAVMQDQAGRKMP
jgi:hypothetical protein